jgi:hypothetical protein
VLADLSPELLAIARTQIAAAGVGQHEVAETITAGSSPQDSVLDILVQTATDPSILGMASHLLYIGQRGETPDASCQPLDNPF